MEHRFYPRRYTRIWVACPPVLAAAYLGVGVCGVIPSEPSEPSERTRLSELDELRARRDFRFFRTIPRSIPVALPTNLRCPCPWGPSVLPDVAQRDNLPRLLPSHMDFLSGTKIVRGP